MREAIQRNILLFIILTFCISCAKVVSPTGGERDETPPKILNSEPARQTTNFNGEYIKLSFDEYVKLDDPNNKMFISPYMQNKPEMKIKGKSVYLNFKEALQPNTTYTIDFGESIKDVNEGNAMKGEQFIFSTGSKIDSFYIKGKILDVATGKGMPDVKVCLYPNSAEKDSLIFKEFPRYLARTEDNGEFRLSFLAAGEYLVFALKEDDNTYKYDQYSESIGFLNDPIIVSDTTIHQNLEIVLFNEGLEKPKLMSKKNESHGKLELIYSMPTSNSKVTFVGDELSEEEYFVQRGEKGDTITMWYVNDTIAQLKFAVEADDLELDTISFRNLIPREFAKELKYQVRNKKDKDAFKVGFGQDIYIKFNHPLTEIDQQKMLIEKDSVKINTESMMQISDLNANVLLIKGKWEEEVIYDLSLFPDATKDLFGRTNDTVQLKFKSRSLGSYGTLKLLFKNIDDEKSYIMELSSAQNKVLKKENLSDSVYVYKNLEPGNYNLKIIFDENKNEKWDPGNWKEQKQSEKIMNKLGAIMVKENWDTDFEVDLNELP